MAEPDGKTSTTISERMNMARAYDSLNAPDPDDWQSMGEEERMMLVMECHRNAGVEMPNEQVHTVVPLHGQEPAGAGRRAGRTGGSGLVPRCP